MVFRSAEEFFIIFGGWCLYKAFFLVQLIKKREELKCVLYNCVDAAAALLKDIYKVTT